MRNHSSIQKTKKEKNWIFHHRMSSHATCRGTQFFSFLRKLQIPHVRDTSAFVEPHFRPKIFTIISRLRLPNVCRSPPADLHTATKNKVTFHIKKIRNDNVEKTFSIFCMRYRLLMSTELPFAPMNRQKLVETFVLPHRRIESTRPPPPNCLCFCAIYSSMNKKMFSFLTGARKKKRRKSRMDSTQWYLLL